MTDHITDDAQPALARALELLKERPAAALRALVIEECAKVVDDFDCHLAGYPNDEAQQYYESGVADACNLVAEHIRALAAQPPAAPVETCVTCNGRREVGGFDHGDNAYRTEPCPECSPPGSSAGKDSEPPEHQRAGRDCPGVLESDPALFNILNNALGTMHYHRLMSALNWNGYIITTREPQASSAGSASALADEIDSALESYIYHGGKREKLEAALWDNKAGIISYLRMLGEPQTVSVTPTGKVHTLKTWPRYFNEVMSGRKPFEWRINDRYYEVGDTLVLQEWEPLREDLGCKEGRYSGRELRKVVSYTFSPFATNKATIVMAMVDEPSSTLSRPEGK